jgi:hypothetical protein
MASENDAIEACLIEARGVCKGCGRRPRHKLHPHHRLPRSRGGKNTKENLLALCFDCHCWVHDHPDEARIRGWTL